jgi:hypothetical protein
MNRRASESSIGTKNRPTPFITTKTVAYIFSLIIDSVTVHHSDSPHSRALQLEAQIIKRRFHAQPAPAPPADAAPPPDAAAPPAAALPLAVGAGDAQIGSREVTPAPVPPAADEAAPARTSPAVAGGTGKGGGNRVRGGHGARPKG